MLCCVFCYSVESAPALFAERMAIVKDLPLYPLYDFEIVFYRIVYVFCQTPHSVVAVRLEPPTQVVHMASGTYGRGQQSAVGGCRFGCV